MKSLLIRFLNEIESEIRGLQVKIPHDIRQIMYHFFCPEGFAPYVFITEKLFKVARAEDILSSNICSIIMESKLMLVLTLVEISHDMTNIKNLKLYLSQHKVKGFEGISRLSDVLNSVVKEDDTKTLPNVSNPLIQKMAQTDLKSDANTDLKR